MGILDSDAVNTKSLLPFVRLRRRSLRCQCQPSAVCDKNEGCGNFSFFGNKRASTRPINPKSEPKKKPQSSERCFRAKSHIQTKPQSMKPINIHTNVITSSFASTSSLVGTAIYLWPYDRLIRVYDLSWHVVPLGLCNKF